MNYGLYLSAAALKLGHVRMDVLANNMANVNTTSFKPDALAIRSRRPAPAERNLPPHLVMPVLDDVRGGLRDAGTFTDLTAGPLVSTDGPLDVAIQGRGFFAVEVDGKVRYTRDGRLARGADGTLVTAAGALPVLDAAGRRIMLGDGPVRIDAAGRIETGGTVVQLGLTDFADERALRKEGANTFSAGPAAGATASTSTVRQGFIEGSGVEPTRALVDMLLAQRTYDAAATMIQHTDAMLGRAVNDIARLA
ncbi:MAG: flagellar hook-basal body protein [Planctomycetes bacterium]|nr:flagellar hook-basal body protein [Planctomycetota bacterium]